MASLGSGSLSTIKVRSPQAIHRANYQEYLETLSLSKVRQVSLDRDTEIKEIHNRIKKLLTEEERTVKKIDETRRKANIIAEIQLKAMVQKQQTFRSLQRDCSATHSNFEVKNNSQSSRPLDIALSRLHNDKHLNVKEIRKES